MFRLDIDVYSLLRKQGCSGFISHAKHSAHEHVEVDPTLNTEVIHRAVNHNRLFEFEIGLTSKINASNTRLARVNKYVKRMFLLTTVPLMILSLATHISADGAQPFKLKPITREVTASHTFYYNTPRFTYAYPLIEASHVAFLASQGKPITTYKYTFLLCVQWLQSHPRDWYTYNGSRILPMTPKYHIGHRDIYIARLDNATHTPYSKKVHEAVIHAEQAYYPVRMVSYISGMITLLSVFIETLMLFYVYAERNQINMVNLERSYTPVGKMNNNAQWTEGKYHYR